jgi:ParB family chromosome partitioning protein
LLGGQSGQTETRALPESGVASLDVDQLEPNRYQPRSYFDETGLEELAESIRHQGVVQPIVVTPRGEDRYTIIAGERRWRAARRAGLRQVPVVLRQVSDDRQILELALVENVQRADLNAVEEAEAYRTLGETFDLSQEEIAARVGKGRTTVTNAIRLLRLPRAIQDLIREGRLTAGQARPLLAIPDAKKQLETAERAVRDGLTARDLEALAAAPRKAETGKAKKKELDVNSRAAVEHLTRVLQTQVDIVRRKRGGTLHIRFHSEEELIRLYDLLIQRAE